MSNFTTPAIQAMNLIRYIGDKVSELGRPIGELSGFSEIIGSPSEELADQIAEELCDRGLVKIGEPVKMTGETIFMNVGLTLDGWDQYESEKRGRFGGNYGFLAMEFHDSELDAFVKDIVKPAVKEGIGYDLLDMNDVARAGIIDNIMRTQIRDAAFVIVDLTHDNSGAYWEAGYAEGLDKPVIYICEKEKFEAKKTHFDTNHCTTVPWSREDDEWFCQKLIATLRQSLDLHQS